MELNPEKGVEVLLYIIEKLGGQPTRHQIAKACYYADRRHLSEYGRFVYDESYSAMKWGTVPSFVYNVIKGEEFDGLVITPNQTDVAASREPDMDHLSKSDIECLDCAIERVKDKSFGELSEESHDEVYNSASLNQRISFNKFVEYSDNPEGLRDYLESHKI